MTNQDMKKKRKQNYKQFVRVFFGRGLITKVCFVVAVIFVFTAIFAPLLAPCNPVDTSPVNKFLPMFSKGHFFGTDRYGRDILSRLIYGTRTSLTCSLLSSLWAAIVGSSLGIVAGYYEGWLGKIIMRYVDIQLSIPALILSMTLAVILGQNIIAISIVLGIGAIPGYIRMAYSNVLSIKENDYIIACRLVGQNGFKIMFKHLLPNCFASLIVIFTMSLGTTIMVESSLAYLGVGLCEPVSAWGLMVSDGFSALRNHPTVALLPGFCIMLVVISFNVLGDGLRDALDPKLRGKL
jgi:peptide/nickel transport system permease protein